MAFLESPRFNDKISRGAVGGPEFKTTISMNDGGFEQRLAHWQYPLHSYDVAFGLKDQTELDEIKNLFMNVQGMRTGFRFKDWSDYTVISAESSMAYIADGIRQLGKIYTSGASTITRPLKKIVDATYAIYKDAVLQTEGAGVGEYAIDITTGLVTFEPDAFGAITGITQASPGVITDISHGRTNGDELDLSEIGGMVELNSQIVTITVLTADTFSIGVNTTAYTAYTSGGLWKKFAQSSEVYTFSSEFDIPVRFGIDHMQASIDSYNVFSWGQIPLVELR